MIERQKMAACPLSTMFRFPSNYRLPRIREMDEIVSQLKRALALDQSKQTYQAYLEYTKCLELISRMLQSPTKGMSLNLFQISRQCLERSEYLFKGITDDEFGLVEQKRLDYSQMKKQVEVSHMNRIQEEKQREVKIREEEESKIAKKKKDLELNDQIRRNWKNHPWKTHDRHTENVDKNLGYETMNVVWIEGF